MATLADLLRSGTWDDGSSDNTRQLVDALRATPRNEILGALSDAMNSGINWMKSPQRTQQLQGLGSYLESTGIPKTAERMAYGEPLTNIGKANVPLMKPETAEAIMNVAPLLPAGKFLPKDVPVGMSIKPITGIYGRESFVPGVEAGKEMIVHHNISPDKLARVEKMGGMPVPSLAISNVENPMLGFGDISLIGAKEMAVPSSKNPVFGFDAYTARAPKVDYLIDPKSKKALEKSLSDIASEIPEGEYSVNKLVNNWEDRKYSDVLKAKFLKDEGYGLPNIEDFKDEPWRYGSALSDSVSKLKGEYADWLNRFENSLPDAGVNIKERLFKGYTYSGNRRYAPATLENFVKEMKGGAGEEGFFYGVPNIRAVATPKFRNLNQVKAARENIITSEQFEPIKKQVEDAFNDITGRLGKLEGTGGYSYEPQNALYEIGQTRNVNLLDKLYKDVPQDLKADVQVFMNKLREMPTEYFEIKPQRAVQVGEFKGAIVPEGAPQQSIDYLRSQGLENLFYYSTPEERKALFKKFGPEMFATMPIGMFGAQLPEFKESK